MHHAFQWSARHGFSIRYGQVVRLIDPTYSFIQLLEKLGLASNIKIPTDIELLQAANLGMVPPTSWARKINFSHNK
jgi:stearoyl-CoA desaturase (delta-9 desaturase)